MRRSRLLFCGVVFAVAMAGCTSIPSTVRAASVSEEPYRGMGCDALLKERTRILTTLAAVSEDQTSKAQRDAFAAVAGVAVSPLFYMLLTQETSGAGEISRLKGEHDALNRVISEKRCAP